MRLVSWSVVSGLLVFANPLLAGLATAYQDATHLYLENDVLKIAVLSSTGNLDGITHKQSGVNLQSNNVNNYKGIWGMSVTTASGLNAYVTNGNTASFSETITTSANAATLNLMWKDLAPGGTPTFPNVTVKAQISVRTDSPLSYWTIEVDGLGTNSVVTIDYPYIPGIGKLGSSADDDQLLLPQEKGVIFHNPTSNLQTPTGSNYPSAYASMQFLAYYDSTAGFYLAADDTNGNAKDFWWGKTQSPAGDFSINMESLLTGTPADSVTLPYNMIVGVTQGDWYAAADIYRAWAVQQSWTQQSRTKKVPSWLHDMPLARVGWGYAYYPGKPDRTYTQFVGDMQQSAHTFGSPLLAQLDGWEKYGAWVEGDYLPPEEGWNGFDTMRQSLSPSRLWLLPSALFLDNSTPLYQSGSMKSSEMLDQQGKERTNPSAGEDSGQWVFMDFSTDPWRQSIVDTYATLAAHGADLLQFDSSMVFGPEPCYNPAHAHPPGMGGNWQTMAWIDIVQRVASAASAENPEVALSAEYPAEVYLPYFALHSGGAPIDQFEHDFPDPNQEPVPLLQYVYHDSIMFVDFFSAPVLDGSYFNLAVARDLIWGQLPNYQMDPYQDPLEAEADAYLQSEITARTTYAKKYLVDGVMLAAPQLAVPTTQVSWINFSQSNTQVTRQYPSVQESAWRASDGAVGIVMTNIAPTSVNFSLPISYSRLGLPAGASFSVQTTDGTSTTILDTGITEDSNYSITLNPQQVPLVTLTPNPPSSMAANLNTTPQSTPAGSPFSNAIAVTVMDSGGHPVAGIPITFTAPNNGASGTFQSGGVTFTISTGANGIASAPMFTANATAGSYSVSAVAAGVASVNFALTNVTALSHPAFFSGEESLGSGVYYLQFADSNPFGYYNYPTSTVVYHYDMGFEAFVPGTGADIYLYDFASGHWWYTSASLFPYLYDFTLSNWIYYFPDTTNPGHYTTNLRYFSNLTTGKIFTM